MASKTAVPSLHPESAPPSAIVRMVSQARPLCEAIAERTIPRPKPVGATIELVREWRNIVAQDDHALFARRLAWDGLTEADVAAALDTPVVQGNRNAWSTLPSWATIFHAAYGGSPAELAAAFAAIDVPEDRARNAREPLAFEPLFLPLIVGARARLEQRIPDLDDLVTADALATLEHSLLKRLAHVGATALGAVFSVQRAVHAFGNRAAGANAAYEHFVDEMCAGRLFDFFVEYPVAARLCATVAQLWTDASAELLGRLRADRAAIAATFANGAMLTQVTGLRTDLSDPHAGGRGVAILSWPGGVSVVYKPRPLGIDATFGRLLHWLNARVAGLALRPLAVVERRGYGWIEFVTARSCPADGAARYYERCGALLCLAYALNGTDFHYQNLLASGEQPVLLDLEMLLGPKLSLVEELSTVDMSGSASHRCTLESVINVRMLPSITARGHMAVETGALGDLMPGNDHLPCVNGVVVGALEYVDHVVIGFERAYRALTVGAEPLLAPDGVLAAMREHPVRFILRDTSLYGSLLARCLHPRFLRSGAARSVQLDVLAKTFLRLDAPPAVWPVLAEEIHDLEQMDVPLLVADADDLSVRSARGRRIGDCLQATAYDEMRRRMHRLNASDLERQVGLIRATFAASAARGLRATAVSSRSGDEPAGDARLDEGALVDAVRAIAERIWAARLCDDGGAVSWIGPRYLPAIRRYTVTPMPHTLLDGYGGVGLFLASVAHVTGEDADVDRARAALRPLMGRLPELGRMLRLRRVVQPGVGCGIGSAAYVLAWASRCLGDTAMMRAAREVATLLYAHGDRVQDCDIISGDAGGILALLAVYDGCGAEEALAAAVAGGRRLLDRRVTDDATGLRVWLNQAGAAETGIAHGQAGIGYALCRLAARIDCAEFIDAAAAAAAYERSDLGSDLRGASGDECRAAWAHGATGIAIARLGSLDVHDTSETRGDIEAALGICQDHRFAGGDSLCCGAAARIELLASAARRLARPALHDAAHGLAQDMVARAAHNGAYDTGWIAYGGRAWQLGLFLGEAGIGLSLLRLICPDRLPSPLAAT